MKLNITVLSIISLSFAACTQVGKHPQSEKNTTDSIPVQSQLKIKNDTLQHIYTAYVGLKDALVASDKNLANSAANKLSQELSLLKGCENTSVLSAQMVKDTTIESQRKKFSQVSQSIIPMFKGTAITAGKIFVQHCPMANNGGGAYWLSSTKEIKNPYYGSAMLDCGSVTETLPEKR